MNHRSIKYFALTTALAGIAAFGTTRVYAEDTPNPTGTDTPVVSTEAPVPSETTEPGATPQTTEAPSAPATQPASTPDETPAYQNNGAKANIASNAVTDETAPAKTGEQQENGHWIYIDETTGQKITSSFKHIDSLNKTVYYDENGYMVYGLQTITDPSTGKPAVYYFLPGTGAQQYGEKAVNGHWYYFDKKNNGAASTGLTDLGYKKVLYNDNGQMLYGENKCNNNSYYSDPVTGQIVYGWYYVKSLKITVYVDNQGHLSRGYKIIGDNEYFFNEDNGAVYTGWREINGKDIYFDGKNGRITKNKDGEQVINNHWKYLKSDGTYATGITNIGYKTVAYDSDGNMLYGLQTIEDKTYYFHPVTGAMEYGEQVINNHWYHFDKNGVMSTGVTDLGYKKVLYNSNGQMLYGSQKVKLEDDDKEYLYYFDSYTGELKTAGWIKDSHNNNELYADEKNHLLVGEQVINDRTYYFDNNGIRKTGWVSEKNSFYTDSGKKLENLSGEQAIEGHWYYFDENTHRPVTGFFRNNKLNKTVYYNQNGQMVYGEACLISPEDQKSHWYYFDKKTGAMATGLTNIGYKTVYYDTNGRMQYGEQLINNNWYYFKPVTGEMATGLNHITDSHGHTKWVIYDNNGRMYHHDVDLNGVHYFVNSVTGEAKVAYYNHGSIPAYKQGDPRWANVRIGGYTIGRTGCVPTALAMAVSSIRYTTVTPPQMAQYLYNNSDTYNRKMHGGSGKAAQVAANHWGIHWQGITSANSMAAALSQGKLVFIQVGPGTFTVPGASHAILLSGNNRGTTYVYDPDNYGGNGYYSINMIWNQRSGVAYDWEGGYVGYALYR